ncbi:MAG TPA: alkaline phosphatase family protein [Gemmatimonadales bacterium]|nr:alkaline phosphatase family protein [Gemmatimonadales bacterium]
MSAPHPLVMIGLDAADLDLVRRLAGEGALPTLRRLMEAGTTGALAGNASRFAGGVWPTFYTGRDVAAHGLFHNKLWRHERMRCEIARADWFPEPPFWERLGGSGLRLAVLDVPMTVATPKPIDGISLAGWGTHDVIARGAWPPALWDELVQAHGKPRMPAELFGAQTPRTLERLETELLAATEQMARIGTSLLARERWDLFLLVLGGLHRGGHYLWDLSQIAADRLSPDRRRRLETSLRRLYEAADRALGAVLAAAPPGARVLVFAVHGMGPNTAWADRCGDILSRIQSGGAGASPRQGLLYAIKRRLPWPLVRAITTRLPASVQSKLVTLWSGSMFDWRTTRAFPLPMDHAGYLRVNLRGREPEGIVEPGGEYQALCDELAAGFESFRDLATGRPIVRRVHRLGELTAADATARDRLPDVVIEWADVSPIHSPGIVSPRYGEMRWEPAGRLPSGRAGNHRAHGWFVAAGPGIPVGVMARDHDIRDLAPTVWRWLGAGPAGGFEGSPIPELG